MYSSHFSEVLCLLSQQNRKKFNLTGLPELPRKPLHLTYTLKKSTYRILSFSYSEWYYTVFSRLDSYTTSVVLKDTIDPYEDFVKMEVAVYGTCDYWTFRRGWKRIRSKHWAKTGISIYRLWVIQRDGKLQIQTLPERIGFVYYLITEELESSLSLQWTLSRIPMITSWFMTSVSQTKRSFSLNQG